MKSSAMTRRFRTLSAAVSTSACVLLFHTASFAQQPEKTTATKDTQPAKGEPAKAEPAAQPSAKQAPVPVPPPPEYGPPPGYDDQTLPQPPGYPPGYDPYYGGQPAYPPPPPRYYQPYRRYYQPAPPPPPQYYGEPVTYRPFSFGFGLGVGGVGIYPHDTSTYKNDSSMGLGYNLRFGIGVAPRWSIVLSADGAQAYFNGVGVSETAWTIGPQVFITRQLYARVGIGGATYSEDACDPSGYYCYSNAATDSGIAGAAAVGFEFMQTYHTALALEAVGTLARFSSNDDKVSTFGINFVLNLF
jgi:hypothetical protein